MIVPGQNTPDTSDEGKEYLATQFTIGGTNFFVSRFKAMHGWAVLESFRHALSGVQNNIKLSGFKSEQVNNEIKTKIKPEDFIELLLKILISLPTRYVDELRQCLFEIVTFSNENAKTRQSLLGAEDMAFQGMQPASIYEVMSRVFVVNFTESLPILHSVFQQILTAILSNMIRKESEKESVE